MNRELVFYSFDEDLERNKDYIVWEKFHINLLIHGGFVHMNSSALFP